MVRRALGLVVVWMGVIFLALGAALVLLARKIAGVDE